MSNLGSLTENFCKVQNTSTLADAQDFLVMLFRKYNQINFNNNQSFALPTYSSLFNQLSGLADISTGLTYPSFKINSYSDGIYLRGWSTGNVINSDQSTYKNSNPVPANVGQYSQVRLLAHGHDMSNSGFTLTINGTLHQHTINSLYVPITTGLEGGGAQIQIPQSGGTTTQVNPITLPFFSPGGILPTPPPAFDPTNLIFYGTSYDVRSNPYTQLANGAKFYQLQAIANPPVGSGNYTYQTGGVNIDDVSPVSYYTNFFISFK